MAGYGAQTAAEIAMRHDIDLHLAIDLLASGCSAELARRSCSSKQAPGGYGQNSLPGELPCLHTVAVERHDRPRPVHDPHVRADALLAIAACLRADRLSLGEVGRRLGSRVPRRGVGRRRRDRGRAPLPRHHELERGARPLVGPVRRLAGRARRLGRDPLRRARRRVGRAPLRARAFGSSWTPSRRGCCWRRGSAASATGSTRSSSASRPTCRGGWRSTRSTGRAGYFNHATFHPTFLYELTYDLIGVAILLWIDRRFKIRRPGLFALYVSYYCFGRFFEELLRVDPAHEFSACA